MTTNGVRRSIPAALTIAGSDSSAGAGIQADLKTFAALGVYGVSAITAVTAQNTVKVAAAVNLAPELVRAQIDAIAADIPLQATKTGMLGSAAIVRAVAAAIRDLGLPLVVVDPVMVAKSGDRLVDEDGIKAMIGEMLRLAVVVTPNIPEAEVLSDSRIRSTEDARSAARRIHALGPAAVIVKGGHGEGPQVIDLLFDGERFTEFKIPRLQTTSTHGTGCTFASAIAACLAHGDSLPAATARAQQYVAGAIQGGLAIGHGHGPLDHFWQTR